MLHSIMPRFFVAKGKASIRNLSISRFYFVDGLHASHTRATAMIRGKVFLISIYMRSSR